MGLSLLNLKPLQFSIYHAFVDRIDNDVPRVTSWHLEASSSDSKQLPEWQICPSFPQTHVGLFFLHIYECQRLNKFRFTLNILYLRPPS